MTTTSSLHPEAASHALLGLARLMPLAFRGEDLTPLAEHMIQRAQESEDDANAWLDLSTILLLQGNKAAGLAVQQQALRMRRAFELKAQRPAGTLRLLALMTPGDLMANSPLDFLLERSDIALTVLYLFPGEPVPQELPEHDVLFVAISQSERTDPLLLRLQDHLAAWPKPVLNRPALIAQTHRASAFRVLADGPGLCMVPTARVQREALDSLAAAQAAPAGLLPGGSFPLIVRPVDSHAGHGLARIDGPQDMAAYLESMPDADFFVSRFVDYASPDGLFRKFRVVLVDGRPFAAHMAISNHWMVHYLNAGMADDAARRADEERFMRTFEADFAARHARALQWVHERLPLDYLVIDCAETRQGDLLLFEVDPGAVVHSMDPVEMFPYKHAPMQKIYAAFEQMLLGAVRPSNPG